MSQVVMATNRADKIEKIASLAMKDWLPYQNQRL
jgi:hypothetical protein